MGRDPKSQVMKVGKTPKSNQKPKFSLGGRKCITEMQQWKAKHNLKPDFISFQRKESLFLSDINGRGHRFCHFYST